MLSHSFWYCSNAASSEALSCDNDNDDDDKKNTRKKGELSIPVIFF